MQAKDAAHEVTERMVAKVAADIANTQPLPRCQRNSSRVQQARHADA